MNNFDLTDCYRRASQRRERERIDSAWIFFWMFATAVGLVIAAILTA